MTEARVNKDMTRMELAWRIGVNFREVSARERGAGNREAGKRRNPRRFNR